MKDLLVISGKRTSSYLHLNLGERRFTLLTLFTLHALLMIASMTLSLSCDSSDPNDQELISSMDGAGDDTHSDSQVVDRDGTWSYYEGSDLSLIHI